jgi:hypothetical protein
MTTEYIFAYGSTMNRSESRSWLEANGYDSSLVLSATPAKLENHELVWNYYSRGRGGGIANVEPREGATVWGVLLEMESHLLKAFDRKYGHPTFFSRGQSRLPVQRLSDGKAVFAWVYAAKSNKGGRRDIWPTRDYKRVVLEAAKFWELPEEYIEKISHLETL